MNKNEKRAGYLSKEQIEVLLKCYYLKSYTKAAADMDMTPGRVKQIKESAFRIIRLAYSRTHKQGLRFEGENVLQYMAERSGIGAEELTAIFAGYISEGAAGESKKYWTRIRGAGAVPTPAELLNFIYDKYEIDIEGFI